MYEKKLNTLFKQAKERAEAALDEEDVSTAAAYYEQCGDILMEQAKNRRGPAKKKKKQLAQKYYEIRDNLVGDSDSLQHETPDRRTEQPETPDEEDFSGYADRFLQETDITWDDVAGIEETKQALKESFALAAIQDKPAAVENLHSILLYGPPGTGKSLLASAVAGSHDYPFFNVKLSQALSKYYGESGKIISGVFEAARDRSPSILFFDELDSVAMARGGSMDEPSRRVLSTLLTELSGLDSTNDDIMFIAATNAPWDLDPAILSRMERVIYVPLPDATTAAEIIRLNTADAGVELGLDAASVAQRCVDGQYSGREIKNLCQEAIRHMIDEENPDLEALSEQPIEEVQHYTLQTRPLTETDFDHAFDAVDPKTDERAIERYQNWEQNG